MITSVEYLEWLIKNNTRNQALALTLKETFFRYRDQLGPQTQAEEVAQSLAAINHSLWRAISLGEVPNHLGNMTEETALFLDRVLLDNSVLYANNEKSRHWNFRYFLQNAQVRLNRLSQLDNPRVLPELFDVSNGLSARDWWLRNQETLEAAVANFRRILNDGDRLSSQVH